MEMTMTMTMQWLTETYEVPNSICIQYGTVYRYHSFYLGNTNGFPLSRFAAVADAGLGKYCTVQSIGGSGDLGIAGAARGFGEGLVWEPRQGGPATAYCLQERAKETTVLCSITE